MPNDPTSAAAREARHAADEIYHKLLRLVSIPGGQAYEELTEIILKHFPPAPPGDGGGEPVTEEWLRSLGAEGLHADAPYFGWGDDYGWLLVWHEWDGTLSIRGSTVFAGVRHTRSDVLKFMSALGIKPSAPQPAGEQP